MKPNQLFSYWLCAALLPCSIVSAQEPAAANGKFAAVNGTTIYYEEYGQGEPLLLLHGFGETAAGWKPYIPAFSKHYRVIAWDMRGHGRSSNPDTSKVFRHATAAADLLALLDNLNLQRVKAIGHSSGGIVLLYAASQAPGRFEAIVPMSAQMYYSAQTREAIRLNAQPDIQYERMGLEKKHGAIKGRLIARQFYHFVELRGDPAITPDQLAAITARTLIIHGDNDFVPVSQAWDMYQHIPGAHLWIVPNGWHLPHVGGARESDFIRTSLEFLSGEWSKGGR